MNEPSVFNGPEVSMQKDLRNLNGEELLVNFALFTPVKSNAHMKRIWTFISTYKGITMFVALVVGRCCLRANEF